MNTTAVLNDVSISSHTNQVPLAIGSVLCEVRLVPFDVQEEKFAGECPGTKDKMTSLLVEREVGDVDVTNGLDECWRKPLDVAVVANNNLGIELEHLSDCVFVDAVERKKSIKL
jgi:hypothetical protein